MRQSPSIADDLGLIDTLVDGRYRVESIAGRGGHGIVYKARHLELNVPVAIKVLRMRDNCDGADREALLSAFRSEARILFELSALNSSFVQAREIGTVLAGNGAAVPYLVLEWLDGACLELALRQLRSAGEARFSPAAVVRLLDGAAAGLAIAHARGIAHRDLKPGNLFLVRQGSTVGVKILDFGLAKIMSDTLSTTAKFTRTRDGAHAFTPAYAAPEQWLGRIGASGTWTDVYAWALVCAELLIGRPALQGIDAVQLMGACLDPLIRPTPRQAGIELAPEVERVIARGLSLLPRDRHRDIATFWSDLCRAVGPGEAENGAELELSCLMAADTALDVPAGAMPSVSESVPATVSRREASPLYRRRGLTRRSAVAVGGVGVLLAALGLLLRSGAVYGTAAPDPAPPARSEAAKQDGDIAEHREPTVPRFSSSVTASAATTSRPAVHPASRQRPPSPPASIAPPATSALSAPGDGDSETYAPAPAVASSRTVAPHAPNTDTDTNGSPRDERAGLQGILEQDELSTRR